MNVTHFRCSCHLPFVMLLLSLFHLKIANPQSSRMLQSSHYLYFPRIDHCILPSPFQGLHPDLRKFAAPMVSPSADPRQRSQQTCLPGPPLAIRLPTAAPATAALGAVGAWPAVEEGVQLPALHQQGRPGSSFLLAAQTSSRCMAWWHGCQPPLLQLGWLLS